MGAQTFKCTTFPLRECHIAAQYPQRYHHEELELPGTQSLCDDFQPFDATTHHNGDLLLVSLSQHPPEIRLRNCKNPVGTWERFSLEGCLEQSHPNLVGVFFATPDIIGVVSTDEEHLLSFLDYRDSDSLSLSLWCLSSKRILSNWKIASPFAYHHPYLAYADRAHLHAINTATSHRSKTSTIPESFHGLVTHISRLSVSETLVVADLGGVSPYATAFYYTEDVLICPTPDSLVYGYPIAEGNNLVSFDFHGLLASPKGIDDFGFSTFSPFRPNQRIHYATRYHNWTLLILQPTTSIMTVSHLFLLKDTTIVYQMDVQGDGAGAKLVGNPQKPQIVLRTGNNLIRIELDWNIMRPYTVDVLLPYPEGLNTDFPAFLCNRLVQNISESAILRKKEPKNMRQSFIDPNGNTFFQLRMLSQQLCQLLVIEFKRLKVTFPGLEDNVKGFSLSKLVTPLGDIYRELSTVLDPLFPLLYPEEQGRHYSVTEVIVAHYRKGDSHDLHVDDSDYTLNVCIGNDFMGGNLCLGDVSIPQQSGFGVVHRGHVEHSTDALTRGDRWNLVICLKDTFLFPFEELPDDVKLYMLKQFKFGIHFSLSQTNKYYNEHCLPQEMWKERLLTENIEGFSLPDSEDFRISYKNFVDVRRTNLDCLLRMKHLMIDESKLEELIVHTHSLRKRRQLEPQGWFESFFQ